MDKNYNEILNILKVDLDKNGLGNILNEIKSKIIIVLGETNEMYYLNNNRIDFYDKVTTGINGFGNEKGSKKTPLGLHKIKNIYGDGLSENTIFKGRKDTGKKLEYHPEFGNIYPAIISRIIQLEGLEDKNSNTLDRYVYIHGNPNEWYWDTNDLKKSYGCIGMKKNKIIELFNKIKNNFNKTFVYILN